MRLDLHNHTIYSPDSRVDPIELTKLARVRGLNGIAITDHNAVEGALKAMDYVRGIKDFIVLPGCEISTAKGHVLGLGIKEAIPRGLRPQETIERIEALGGVAVAAHPYRFWSGLGEEHTVAARFRAYETRNARTLALGNARAAALAGVMGVGQTGGSDAHFPREIGRAFTVLNSGVTDEDSILQDIVSHRTTVDGSNRHFFASVTYVTKCVSEWLARGMKKM